MRPRVSLTMIVRDGAPTLDRCLNSVAGLVDEVVVVDTGSADASRDVAERLGARVFDFAWTDSFAAARNESLRHARGDWAFWLDADEWLDGDARERFRALTGRLGDENSVYFMEQASPLGGQGAGTLSVRQPRLFRNGPGVRWRYRVHEQVVDACLRLGARACPSDVVIRHSGYDSAEGSRRKHERNLRLLELERAEKPDDLWVLLQLGRLLPPERSDEALALFLRVLERSGAADPLRRQGYALLAKGYRSRGKLAEADGVLREGLGRYPNDTNLLVEAGALALQGGDLDRGGSAFTNLLAAAPDPDEYLGGVDPSWRGWQARHGLAVVRYHQGREAEAEAQWRAAVVEAPGAARLWLGLAEIYLAQARWPELDEALGMVDAHADGPEDVGVDVDVDVDVSPEDAPLLRARAHLARREFAPARALLAGLIARHPGSTRPRLLLSRACLLEGDDLDTAEQALRDVLAIDPSHAEARRGLAALLAYLPEDDDGPDDDR